MTKTAPSAAPVTTFRPAKAGADALAKDILRKLAYGVGKTPEGAKSHDWLAAAILAIRDRVIDSWMNTVRDVYDGRGKRVYYLSMEFLIGRLLRDAVTNLGLMDDLKTALHSLGVELDLVEALEPDAGLGNGGLGRLAACFMESMASMGIPAYGYGIRYRYGLFRQMIIDGVQVEMPDDWLADGNPWEFERREREYKIGFGGGVEVKTEKGGEPKYTWRPGEQILAVAYDTPICGWRGKHVNTLRLWDARPTDPIRLAQFNSGDHIGAQEDEARAEAITRVLYPSDESYEGKELRLRQEFFFTSASLQDMIRRHMGQHGDILTLADKAAVQMNDTHPAIAVAELMRLLVDDHGLAWAKAWEVTQSTVSYTNHTLLPEALETWPVHLFERLLPRHMQIIYAINAGVIADAHKQSMTDFDFLGRVSLIDENNGKRVRMGQLAFVGSHSINGVSALHSDLMKQTVFKDLNTLYPGRINNKTNGVTPRRWIQQVNPGLTALVQEAIGPKFLDDTMEIKALDKFASDSSFRDKFAAVKRANKAHLAQVIGERTGIKVDPSALFDVQITNTSANFSPSLKPSRSTTPCAPTPSATGCRV
jgi:glycogen phosphorylase